MLWIKSRKGLPVVFTFAQNGNPGQARLRPLQQQKLEKYPVIVLWNAPFGIVVGHVKWVFPAPGAAGMGLMRVEIVDQLHGWLHAVLANVDAQRQQAAVACLLGNDQDLCTCCQQRFI